VYRSTQQGVDLIDMSVDKIQNYIDAAYYGLESYAQEASKKSEDTNAGLLLDAAYAKVLDLLRKDDPNLDINLANAMYKAKLNDERSDYAINDYYELSAKGLNEMVTFEGEQYTMLKSGYLKLIEFMSAKMPANLIKLNEAVLNIDSTNFAATLVQTYNNSTKTSAKYEAKVVIVTVSLGYLKAKHTTLFKPLSCPRRK
jgi:hypothetical protein